MTLGNKLVSMTVSRKAGINPLNFILKKKITVKASPMKKKNCKTGKKKNVFGRAVALLRWQAYSP